MIINTGAPSLAHSPKKLCKDFFLYSFFFLPPPSLLSCLPAPSFPPSFLLPPPFSGLLEDAGAEAVLPEMREPNRASNDIGRIAGA